MTDFMAAAKIVNIIELVAEHAKEAIVTSVTSTRIAAITAYFDHLATSSYADISSIFRS